MSLVGPRPHPLADVARYGRDDYRRLLAKPGLSGLWPAAGGSDLDWRGAIGWEGATAPNFGIPCESGVRSSCLLYTARCV